MDSRLPATTASGMIRNGFSSFLPGTSLEGGDQGAPYASHCEGRPIGEGNAVSPSYGAPVVPHRRDRAIFLDRDGVINRPQIRNGIPHAPATVDQWELLPGVAETLTQLRQDGFRLIVVTNQPDVAKGMYRREAVEAIHERMRQLLPLDGVKVCYHVDQDGCACRKPKPGMLLEAANEWDVDLGASVMIGDRWRDIGAGKAVGCKTILIEGGYADPCTIRPDAVAHSLPEAGSIIRSRWLCDGTT